MASLLLSLVIAAMLPPALAKAKHTQRPSDCQRNLRGIGLAFKAWALDHNDQYPFNMSTNNGGRRELCDIDHDGFDQNAIAHFVIISNELSSRLFWSAQMTDALSRRTDPFAKRRKRN